MAEVPYLRLTRARLRSTFAVAVTSRSILWLGPDHLLVVDTSGYTETYKRFYFRDVQSFTVILNKARLRWNWALGILTALVMGIWALSFASTPPASLTLPLVALGTIAIFAVPLILNNVRGPTCSCYVRTAVQTEQLCSIKRLALARKIMDRLRPLITAAQGGELQPQTATAELPVADAASAEAAPSEAILLPAEPTPDADGVSPRISG